MGELRDFLLSQEVSTVNTINMSLWPLLVARSPRQKYAATYQWPKEQSCRILRMGKWGAVPPCPGCGKPVYTTEQVFSADRKPFHKQCLQCTMECCRYTHYSYHPTQYVGPA